MRVRNESIERVSAYVCVAIAFAALLAFLFGLL